MKSMAEARANSALGGYDEDFVDVVEDEWSCPICQLPLKEAVQTGVCGHRFCRQCLDGHFKRQERDGEPLTCPVDRNNLTREKDMFLDKATERKILSFIIKCPSEGCQWTGELRSKDGHLVSCPFKVVSCANENCHVTTIRAVMQDHVTKNCQWRIIHCDHCNASHPFCKTAVHQNGCKRFPLACPNRCGAISIPREEISAHTEKDCMMAIISCPYVDMGCIKKVQRGKVESHLQSDMRLHLDLACVKLYKTEVLFRETTKKLEEKISALENKPLQCQGVYTWRISGFREILRKNTAGSKMYSAPFYTGENGYKVRLRLYPNGTRSGKNTHLSLFLTVMKGEYDPILPWPFHKKLIFMLIDQQQNLDEREDIVRSLITEPEDKASGARPVTEENRGRGFPRFVSHDELEEEGYFVDDTIFIQVKVVPPI